MIIFLPNLEAASEKISLKTERSVLEVGSRDLKVCYPHMLFITSATSSTKSTTAVSAVQVRVILTT